jgi:hypothetical protein
MKVKKNDTNYDVSEDMIFVLHPQQAIQLMAKVWYTI